MLDLKIAKRALFAGGMVLTCAVLAARLAAWGIASRGYMDALGLVRLRQMLSALPRIAAGPEKKGVVLGASAVIQGFSPEEFDARLAEEKISLTSYNLGLNSPDPLILRLLTARIRAIFERRSERIFLSIIEFSPSDATQAAEFGFEGVHAVHRAELTNWSGLAELLIESPRMGVELGALKALGGYEVSMLSAALRQRLYISHEKSTEQADLLKELNRELSAVLGEGDIGQWNRRQRGGQRILFPGTRNSYTALVRASTYAQLADDRQGFVEAGDILELHFSEEAIADFIRAAKNLQAVSEHTYVLISPRDAAWIEPTHAGAERLNRALSRIERETGAKTIDFYSDREFQSTDFLDVVHLNEISGRPKFMKALAKRTAALMRTSGFKGRSP